MSFAFFFPCESPYDPKGGYLEVLALQRKALAPIGRYCPISRIFAFHKGLVGRIPLSRGRAFRRINDNDAKIRYP